MSAIDPNQVPAILAAVHHAIASGRMSMRRACKEFGVNADNLQQAFACNGLNDPVLNDPDCVKGRE